MNRVKKITMVSFVAGLFVLSCAHKPSPAVYGLGSADSSRATVGDASSVVDAWEKLETQPGEPGVDYNPGEILVSYQPDPLPLEMGIGSAADGNLTVSDASAMPNSILRSNRQFEPITDAIARELGLAIQTQVYQGNINAASFRLKDDMNGEVMLATLRLRFAGQVEHAVFSPLHHAAYIPNDPDFVAGADGRQWSHWRIGCPEAWDYELGEETVLVAVVDTGVRLTHEELSGQVLDPLVHFPSEQLDIANQDNTVEDLNGHGTFIAGLAVATGNNERKITGVAPGCRVLPVKISDDLAAGTLDLIAGCLLAYNLGAKVINLSFSTPTELSIERDMVNQIWDGGSVLVSVASNYGVDTAEYPGAFENAICVGSTDKEDARRESSNYGITVNVAAPGMGLKSCTINSDDNSYYSNGAGTSYSAGIVSGALGLLFSLDPDVTNTMARQALESTGLPVAGFVGDVKRIDIGAAAWELVSDNLAVASGLSISPAVSGTVVEAPYLNLAISGASKVVKVIYTLDLEPVGVIEESDPVVVALGGGDFYFQLPVPVDCHNQQARIIAQPYSSYNIAGEALEQDVLIYNLRGDTDCDGVVDALDVVHIESLLGLTEFDPGYSIFADTNLDGEINELDLAWVGYAWGS